MHKKVRASEHVLQLAESKLKEEMKKKQAVLYYPRMYRWMAPLFIICI